MRSRAVAMHGFGSRPRAGHFRKVEGRWQIVEEATAAEMIAGSSRFAYLKWITRILGDLLSGIGSIGPSGLAIPWSLSPW